MRLCPTRSKREGAAARQNNASKRTATETNLVTSGDSLDFRGYGDWLRDGYGEFRRGGVWQQGDAGSKDDDEHADPDPVHERVHERLDSREFAILTGIDDVEVFFQRRPYSDHGAGLLSRLVNTALGKHLSEIAPVLVHVESGVFGLVISKLLLGVLPIDERVVADGELVVSSQFGLFGLVE